MLLLKLKQCFKDLVKLSSLRCVHLVRHPKPLLHSLFDLLSFLHLYIDILRYLVDHITHLASHIPIVSSSTSLPINPQRYLPRPLHHDLPLQPLPTLLHLPHHFLEGIGCGHREEGEERRREDVSYLVEAVELEVGGVGG